MHSYPACHRNPNPNSRLKQKVVENFLTMEGWLAVDIPAQVIIQLTSAALGKKKKKFKGETETVDIVRSGCHCAVTDVYS